jgi:osmoprotectant transport system ATP-binding protein
MVNRLVDPTSGRVTLDGQDVARLDPVALRRGIGYLTATGGLLPHKDVLGNVCVVPRLLGWERDVSRKRALEVLELVGISAARASAFPSQLDAVSRQRVALARAVAAEPGLLLLDEPFAMLDTVGRDTLGGDLERVQAWSQPTVLLATDQLDEALRLADHLAVLGPGGRLAQDGPPADLLTLPVDEAVAAVVGDHRGLKRLALLRLDDVQSSRGPVVTPLATASQARAAAESGDSTWVLVVDVDDRLLGWADTSRLGPTGYVTDTPLLEVERTVTRADTLLTVLDQMVLSPARMAVRVEADGRLGGVITNAVLDPQLPQAGTGW